MTDLGIQRPGPGIAPPGVALLLIWAGIVVALAVTGAFDVPPDQPALPTLVAIAVPVLAFLGAVFLVPGVRSWALDLDPVLLTEFQAWRIMGGAFLIVLFFGHLPAIFAWPAGVGDVAVGLAAPFMAMRLRQRPGFLRSRQYLSFLVLRLVDFAVAITIGVASRSAEVAGEVTSVAMGQVPLVLIPTLAVPAFIILHLIVLLQILTPEKEN